MKASDGKKKERITCPVDGSQGQMIHCGQKIAATCCIFLNLRVVNPSGGGIEFFSEWLVATSFYLAASWNRALPEDLKDCPLSSNLDAEPNHPLTRNNHFSTVGLRIVLSTLYSLRAGVSDVCERCILRKPPGVSHLASSPRRPTRAHQKDGGGILRFRPRRSLLDHLRKWPPEHTLRPECCWQTAPMCSIKW